MYGNWDLAGCQTDWSEGRVIGLLLLRGVWQDFWDLGGSSPKVQSPSVEGPPGPLEARSDSGETAETEEDVCEVCLGGSCGGVRGRRGNGRQTDRQEQVPVWSETERRRIDGRQQSRGQVVLRERAPNNDARVGVLCVCVKVVVYELYRENWK